MAVGIRKSFEMEYIPEFEAGLLSVCKGGRATVEENIYLGRGGN